MALRAGWQSQQHPDIGALKDSGPVLKLSISKLYTDGVVQNLHDTQGFGVTRLSSTKLPFEEAALERILLSAGRGEVHVIVAPPGVGKSVTLRKLIAVHHKAGGMNRVLWATHSMRLAGSLGDEAKADFDSQGIDASIIYSREDLTAQGRSADYATQLDWTHPGTPPVKVISHARVGQIFGPSHHQARSLEKADLLVIDEEPFGSLSLHAGAGGEAPLRLSELIKASTSPVFEALLQVALEAKKGGTPEAFEDLKGRVTGHHLTGREFWRSFLSRHPGPVDAHSLTAGLERARVQHAAFVARCFADDAAYAQAHPDDPRIRFGLDWKGAGLLTPCLRYDLSLPLTFDLPVLILDGYADPAHYAALFPDMDVHLHEFAPGPVLHVECTSLLTVHESREGVSSIPVEQEQRRKQIAEEIALRAKEGKEASPSRGTLVLSSRRLKQENSEWTSFLNRALDLQGLALGIDVFTTHWGAGRGKNAYQGYDVFAVHRPYLNRRHRVHTLTALYPLLSDTSRREEASKHLIAAETLQMLHRGRQTRHAGPGRPRVVLGYDLEDAGYLLAPLKDQVRLREYVPLLHFKGGSNNPRWIDGMTPLVKDLLTLFPDGLPRALVGALPQHSNSQTRTPAIREFLKQLTVSRPGTPLHRAFHDRRTWTHSDIEPGGTGSNFALEEELMERCGLEKKKASGRGHGHVVYVQPGGDPNKALSEFEARIRSAKTAAP